MSALNIPRKNNKKSCFNKKSSIYILAAAVSVLAVAFGIFLLSADRGPFSSLNPQADDEFMASDLARLSEESYESVLLSMHSTESFSEEDFAYFRGLDTLVASHAILDTSELSQYLDSILNSGNPVTNLYLCLDPELLWTTSGQNETRWNSRLEAGLYSYVEANPDISFEILLPYPYIDYWLGLEDEQLDTLLTVYHTLVNQLSSYANARIFFPGFEDWVMVNPDNYTNFLFDANEIITQKLFLYTFCDGVYQITPDNEDTFWNSLRETIANKKKFPSNYPDLSQWHLVFFGDSVLANFPGSFSIPGYMAGLSDITFDNYAVGGTCAAFAFPSAVNTFLSEKCENQKQPWPGADKRLCFLISYGLNDYFTGGLIDNPQDFFDSGTYKGSLRIGISQLQEAFPEAVCIIMTPTHISFYENGTIVMSENGDVFTAYVEAAREISSEMELYLIDNYDGGIITADNLAEYVSDGVHPSEKGRLAIAVRIMEFLGGL